tara:strand:- start:3029 stop:3502 length:474 start_codon:yes stop_codon:yes gene_type:complete
MGRWEEFINELSKKRKIVARIICFNEKKEFLIIKRSPQEDSYRGYWDLPGGHVDKDDYSIEMGAIRELDEETSLVAREEDLIYVGQTENKEADCYFYTTNQWQGSVKFKKNPKSGIIEHSEAKWVTIDRLKGEKTLELRTFPAYLLDKAIEKIEIKN